MCLAEKLLKFKDLSLVMFRCILCRLDSCLNELVHSVFNILTDPERVGCEVYFSRWLAVFNKRTGELPAAYVHYHFK
jgi:hypothetical protein